MRVRSPANYPMTQRAVPDDPVAYGGLEHLPEGHAYGPQQLPSHVTEASFAAVAPREGGDHDHQPDGERADEGADGRASMYSYNGPSAV